MEKVANSSIEFSVSGNKASSDSDDVVRLRKRMGFHVQGNDLGRPFDGGGGGGRHDICYGGGATEAVGHVYGGGVSSSHFGGESFATSSSTNSQRFDVFAAAYSASPFKSPEEMANAAFPFTFAQWKELERQAMIYKCMISSVPVPPDLLFPHSRNYSVAALDSPASLYSGRYSRNGDPEPGRCKRTDGKKWRCSKDVAPHQKYCERHLHRGRPRSRKPVEVKNNGENLKKTRIEHAHVPNSTASTQPFAAGNDKPLLLFNAKNELSVSAPPYVLPIRDLNLMNEDTHQQLQHSIEGNMGFANMGSSVYGTSSFFHQDYAVQQPLNVPSYSSFPASEIDTPTGFIDAWSIHNLDSSSSGNAESSTTMNHGHLSSPSLNLSIAMGAGHVVDQEMGSIEFRDEQSVQDSRWMNPVSWEPFAQGGPLAEALQLGSFPLSACKNLSSPRDSIGTPATTVSSPSGVLHRTLFSHSDGSVCNSPTPTPAAPTSETGFHQPNSN